MIVELHGAGFLNKGAQLMLLTAAARLRAAGVQRIAIEQLPGHPVEALQTYDLEPLFPSVRPFPQAKPIAALFLLSRLAGRGLPRARGRILRQEPDALIDISGYAFGDRWGHRRVRNFARRAAYYRKKGKPVVLLPQMFGPFSQPKVAAGFKQLLGQAILCYARDRISLQAVERLGGRPPTLRQAPDITIFSPSPDVQVAERAPFGCLVPNQRVLDGGADKAIWQRVYLDRMVSAGEQMRDAGLDVLIVVHDTGGEDRPLAEQLQARLPGAQVLEHEDPLRLKAIVADAKLLVGSRFHSIVAALSTGVPAVALGWGHKYEMLLEDFGVPDFIHGATSGQADLQRKVAQLCDDEANAEVRATLKKAKAAMQDVNAAMWRDVLELLGLRP